MEEVDHCRQQSGESLDIEGKQEIKDVHQEDDAATNQIAGKNHHRFNEAAASLRSKVLPAAAWIFVAPLLSTLRCGHKHNDTSPPETGNKSFLCSPVQVVALYTFGYS